MVGLGRVIYCYRRVFAESNYISYLKLVCLQIAPVEHKDLGLHNGEGVVK
jgi:hypothetical protein